MAPSAPTRQAGPRSNPSKACTHGAHGMKRTPNCVDSLENGPETEVSQSSKLTDVSHHKGELSFVSKLRLQLMYDLPELGHKICGIIFHSENSNIITYQRSRSNSFFAFKVTDSSRGLSRNVREKFAKCSRVVREGFVEGS